MAGCGPALRRGTSLWPTLRRASWRECTSGGQACLGKVNSESYRQGRGAMSSLRFLLSKLQKQLEEPITISFFF